jgi:ribosomal protein S4
LGVGAEYDITKDFSISAKYQYSAVDIGVAGTSDKDKFEGTVKAMPTREDITLPIQEQLIVELYSR